jgi:hypothetical protein
MPPAGERGIRVSDGLNASPASLPPIKALA